MSGKAPNLGAKKSTQTFSVQSFSRTLRVMDVRAENPGRPHQKVGFPVLGCRQWGCNKWGLKGCLAALPGRPFSPFFCLSHPVPEGVKGTWKIQKTEEKGLFPQISSDVLKPSYLKPHLRHPRLILATVDYLHFRVCCVFGCSFVGAGKRGHYERGLFTGGSSRISNSLESVENGRIFLCFPQSGGQNAALQLLPGDWENSGVRVGNVCRKFGPKSICLLWREKNR